MVSNFVRRVQNVVKQAQTNRQGVMRYQMQLNSMANGAATNADITALANAYVNLEEVYSNTRRRPYNRYIRKSASLSRRMRRLDGPSRRRRSPSPGRRRAYF